MEGNEVNVGRKRPEDIAYRSQSHHLVNMLLNYWVMWPTPYLLAHYRSNTLSWTAETLTQGDKKQICIG